MEELASCKPNTVGTREHVPRSRPRYSRLKKCIRPMLNRKQPTAHCTAAKDSSARNAAKRVGYHWQMQMTENGG